MFEDIYQRNTEDFWKECQRKEEEILGIAESVHNGFFGSSQQSKDDNDIEQTARGFMGYYENDFVVEDEFDEEKKTKMIELIKKWLEKKGV
jgi:hypothetical protein